jgi:hypothetical protein
VVTTSAEVREGEDDDRKTAADEPVQLASEVLVNRLELDILRILSRLPIVRLK